MNHTRIEASEGGNSYKLIGCLYLSDKSSAWEPCSVELSYRKLTSTHIYIQTFYLFLLFLFVLGCLLLCSSYFDLLCANLHLYISQCQVEITVLQKETGTRKRIGYVHTILILNRTKCDRPFRYHSSLWNWSLRKINLDSECYQRLCGDSCWCIDQML